MLTPIKLQNFNLPGLSYVVILISIIYGQVVSHNNFSFDFTKIRTRDRFQVYSLGSVKYARCNSSMQNQEEFKELFHLAFYSNIK